MTSDKLDMLESDILIYMMNPMYETLEPYKLSQSNGDYFIQFNNRLINYENISTKVFEFKKVDGKYKIIFKDIKRLDEYVFLNAYNLTEIEKYYLVSVFLDNNHSKVSLPDSIRRKLLGK